MRLRPDEKPKPPSFPSKDPLAFLIPLFDAYAAPARAENLKNPRLSPIVASLETLPENMLFVIPTIDILLHEQLTFVERLQQELAKDPKQSKRRIESKIVEGQFHGYLECKYSDCCIILIEVMGADHGSAFGCR